MRNKFMQPVVAVVACLLLVGGVATTSWAGSEDWNDAQIEWLSYEDGLRTAKDSSRPLCLIFYTTWCPHCANYAKVFKDERVVEKAKQFVMVRLDKDKNRELSREYSPDGEYIPRTYFLSSSGVLDAELTETREQFKYFYSESDPASLLAGMDRALAKLKK